MTLDEAKKLAHGTILHRNGYHNADGTPQRWRVNGATDFYHHLLTQFHNVFGM